MFIDQITRQNPGKKLHWELGYDELLDQGYTSLPKPDESESGQMVLK